ncbi:MAG: hypothetical protein ACE5H0_04325 [Bacteroidota bacterium]
MKRIPELKDACKLTSAQAQANAKQGERGTVIEPTSPPACQGNVTNSRDDGWNSGKSTAANTARKKRSKNRNAMQRGPGHRGKIQGIRAGDCPVR